MKHPLHIVISGIDGSGKTTVIEELIHQLEKRGVRSHYVWLRYTHILAKLMHAFARIVGLTKRYSSASGFVWRHEFCRSKVFCSLYIPATWFDTLFGRLRLEFRLQHKEVDVVICDRWVNDILIDLAVDTQREDFLSTNWVRRFRSIQPKGTRNFLIVRASDAILESRPESREDPNFIFRLNMYKSLSALPQMVETIDNDTTIDAAVMKILARLGPN